MRGFVIAPGRCEQVRECVAPGGQTGLRPCVRSGSFSKRAERNGRRASWVLAANSASPVRALTRLERAKRHARCGRRRDWSGGSGLRRGVSKPRWTRYLRCVQHSDRRGDTVQTDVTHSGWKTPNARAAPRVSRTIPNARMGEALFGRQELHTPALRHRFRRRSRTLAWAKPCLAARSYTLPHCATGSDGDHRPTHGRSPVWRADPRRSYERNFPRSTPRVAARLGWSFLITP
jgi:hypothetical protein